MKVVDQTPFYKENGELSSIDRVKAIMKFGAGWFKEIEAQKSVIAVLDKALDKNYTLLHNVTPAGLDARIPLILVGPTGVFVMCVTPLIGMFRAKGDQWGTITGNAFKPERPNLLPRTERMARAIQVFLQRQGYANLLNVEAVLLCSDPSVHVDSTRPIIRVVMRDALERFAVSITQARVVFSPESVHDVVNRILNPPAPTPPKPVETAAASASIAATGPEEDPNNPAFAVPGSESIPASAGVPTPPGRFAQTVTTAVAGTQIGSSVRRRRGITGKQWAFLIGMLVIWCLMIAVFIFLILRDQSLLSLTH